MMTDAELKRCLNDYECESLPQMLREVAANSMDCTSEAGGRIPTWPLHEAAERLEAMLACVEALEVFAQAARVIDIDPPDDGEPSHGRGYVKAGDLRRARAALASLKGGA
jgi:hypothetical protein